MHPTPGRDDGYDVTDFYGIDPRLGTLGDLAELLDRAANRGIKVIIDLVVNHTSDEHPWFVSAVAAPDSPYRDWYVWSADEPADRHQGMVFPGEQTETWTWHDQAQAWYYHRFYDFQPDLNFANPAVRDEVRKIIRFWLRLGVAGFRIDALPFIIESWFEKMIRTLRECPEIGCGDCKAVDVDLPAGVLAHRSDGASGTMVVLHNLADEPHIVDLSELNNEIKYLDEVLADHPYEALSDLGSIALDAYGYRWLRLDRRPGW